MIHHSFKTLISIILMGASLGGYSQSINTTFIKSTQERSSYNQAQESVSKSDSLVELTDEVKTNSRLKAHTTSVTINDSETWDEWQTLGTADMTTDIAYSDFHKEVTVYKRYSTVSGHEKIFQIKIPGILDGYDAILWGEENDRQPEVTIE